MTRERHEWTGHNWRYLGFDRRFTGGPPRKPDLRSNLIMGTLLATAIWSFNGFGKGELLWSRLGYLVAVCLAFGVALYWWERYRWQRRQEPGSQGDQPDGSAADSS